MAPGTVRILLFADSHLGFDLPRRPRSMRRRRGYDFLANHEAALEPALKGEVDIVVHGGDVFHYPDVDEGLAWRALRPLVQVADAGVPVFIVPGNHERARIPHARFADHPRVHVFDRARTFTVDLRGVRVALSGFPYERRDVRTRFPALVENTGWRAHDADVRLLCMHHCAEGATVGPGDFTFTTARDVVRLRDVPPEFAAVLSGHIHRQQVLTEDLRGRPVDVPVLYPGSVERTAYAEMGERKGYLLVDVEVQDGRPRVTWDARALYARPMVSVEVDVAGRSGEEVDRAVREIVAGMPEDAVLRVRVTGALGQEHFRVLRAAYVRGYAPATMNVEIQAADEPFRRRRSTREAAGSNDTIRPQLELGLLH